MTDDIRPLIAGNWKMNGLRASLGEFEAMLAGASEVADKADLLVCPPATLIAAFAEKAGGAKAVAVGAQDCHPEPFGAHTGDVSAENRGGLARGPHRDRLHRRNPAPARRRSYPRHLPRAAQRLAAGWRAGG